MRRSQIRGFRVTRADQSNRRNQRETQNQNHAPPPFLRIIAGGGKKAIGVPKCDTREAR